MNFIDIVFFFYMFVGLYMTMLMLLVYFPNRKNMFFTFDGKPEPVSIVMPCWNEADTIGQAIEGLLKLDWPKNMLEIIVVDDCSKDNSVEVIKKYVKKYKNVKGIYRSKNSGGAATPTNDGIKVARYKYVAVADGDAVPNKEALRKMIGFLQKDEKIAGVTCAVLVNNPNKFFEKLQAIEYVVIAFARKLLDFVDAVYVTPGPFALYKKDILIEIGLFDPNNITQDIEIVWRLMSKGYKARMALSTRVYVRTPKKVRAWWHQRVRWSIGGTQTLWRYKSWAFRKNMLGLFIIPFFSASSFLGILGLGIFSYLIIKNLASTYFTATYSVGAETAVVAFRELSFNPSILNFFGAALFLLGIFYMLFGIFTMKELKSKFVNFYTMTFFLTLYLIFFPVIMIDALVRMAIGKYSW